MDKQKLIKSLAKIHELYAEVFTELAKSDDSEEILELFNEWRSDTYEELQKDIPIAKEIP